MYDEFERAMTGRRPRKGLSVLGWVAATFAFIVMVGVVGVGFAVNRAANEFEDFARNFDVSEGLSGLAMLADLESQTRLLSMDPQEGLDFLEGLDAGDPAEAFLGEVVRGSFDLAQARQERRVKRRVRTERSVQVDTDVRVDLDRSDDGGSLVINADGEEIRFNLRKTDSGGFLTIDADGGQTRIDLVGDGEGGYLAIDSDDGNVRFDLQKRGEGGELVIRTDDETVRLGVGEGAQAMPRWVPEFDGMPPTPRPVYSLDADEGFLGAVAWSTDASPAQILSFYRDALEDQGYELKDRVRHTDADGDEGAFWARNLADGRMVFVVAQQEAGDTRVLLGYGEER